MKKELLEIINNDIQEIGDITNRLKTISKISQIDIDLLLSKVRDIYDTLLLLNKIGVELPEIRQEQQAPPKSSPKGRTPLGAEDKDNHRDSSIEKISEDIVQGEIPVKSVSEHQLEIEPEQTETLAEPDEDKTPVKHQDSKQEKTIVADRFKDSKKLVNEIAENKKEKDIADKLQSQILGTISDIKSAISLNDKIWFIKELFDGSTEKYDKTVDLLNNCNNLDEALKYSNNNFKWDQESQSTKKFLELVYRRFK